MVTLIKKSTIFAFFALLDKASKVSKKF